MSKLITGTYYLAKSSEALDAHLTVNDDMVSLHYQQRCQKVYGLSDLTQSTNIPGVPFDVVFPDGGKFSASNADDRMQHSGGVSLESLEKSKTLIVSSIVLVPVMMWFVLMVLMPFMAKKSVPYIPEIASQQMGEQAFKIIQETMLEPSEVAPETQEVIKQQWAETISALGLSSEKYRLHIYASEYMGANAFALPDGTVVVTDGLIEQLDNQYDPLLAVMLHEIGHVEHKHSLTMVAQSVSSTVAIAMIFGDIEGIGEIIIGTGSTLVEAQFSRNMESQADDYALEQLIVLGKSPEAFADAMQSFLDEHDDSDNESVLRYLSSHPDTQDRIDYARNYKKD